MSTIFNIIRILQITVSSALPSFPLAQVQNGNYRQQSVTRQRRANKTIPLMYPGPSFSWLRYKPATTDTAVRNEAEKS
ncbi:hypothetical protein RRG08_062592 [Elysia crispata]|uniref:Secreted protein n=1 Tax=Elysia crispata TaxID=231223 RepID=A0AAE0YYU2_9GAST|nr:hypothetical protein RRG08_062592 [Elysia crispata]